MRRGFLKSAPGKKSPLALGDACARASINPISDGAARKLKESSSPSKPTTDVITIRADTTTTLGFLIYQQARAENLSLPPYPPLSVATLPPQKVGAKLPDYPGGWAECILDDPHIKGSILKAPGFPAQVEKPPKVRHRVDRSKIAGLGVFATVDLKLGDLILSERPLLVAPVCQPDLPASAEVNATKSEIEQARKEEWESWLRVAADRMVPEARMAFYALNNVYPDMPIQGRFISNAFQLSNGRDHPLSEYGGVHNEITRINHSCLPSVTVRFNEKTFASEVRAVRSIQSGEELLVSYTSTSESKKEREAILDRLGFKCQCPICVDPKAIDLRQNVQESTKKLNPLYSNGPIRSDAQLKPKKGINYTAMIKNSERWMKVMGEIGMEESEVYNKHLSVALNAARVLQDANLIRFYLQKRLDWVRVVFGPD